MIGIVTTDEDGAIGFALGLPIMADHAENGVVGFGPRIVEEDIRQAAVGQAGNLRREHHRRRRHGLEESIVERQFPHLLGRNVGKFVAAVTDVDAPQAGHAVENALTVAIDDVTAIGVRDDPASAQVFDQLIVLLGRQMVGHVKAAKLGDIVVTRHGSVLVQKADHREARGREGERKSGCRGPYRCPIRDATAPRAAALR